MSVETTLPNAVMEGNGAYNQHATVPALGAATAIPLLEIALRRIPLHPEDQPLVMVDYGSSQGKNSLAPIGMAMRNLRSRVAPARAIFVYHVDQPSNDFNSLFGVLTTDPDSYARADSSVYPCAIGRSFYEQVLPAGSVHLAWSSYAAVWVSRTPSLIRGHFYSGCATGEARAAFERQAAEDWKTFLALRSKEMRPGARLVVVLPGAHDQSGFTEVMNRANEALVEMVKAGSVTAEERTRMVLRAYPRRTDELLAPFKNDTPFPDLVVEDLQELPLPDSAWADYQVDGDEHALANKQALFFRAVFMPSLAAGLDRVRDGNAEAVSGFADDLQRRLTRRLAENPVASDTIAQTIVVAKQE
jgi:S-adenosylmethionine-dependent carboxyl methyltransferase